MAFWRWFSRSRVTEFDDELRSHFQMAVRERVAAGEDPESARRAALKEFGNVTLTREAARRVWRGQMVEGLLDAWQDVSYAGRLLWRSPGYAVAVVLVLALGIGANVSVFSLFTAAFIRPLPGVEDTGTLAVVVGRAAPDNRIVTLSYPDYRYLREHDTPFAALLAMSPVQLSLGLGLNGERVWGELVSDNYFQSLGVTASLGRTLLRSDDPLAGGTPVVVISDGLWRRSFGADPAVVGRTVRINGRPFTVVGVAEPGFHGTMVGVRDDLFLPLTTMTSSERLEAPDNRWLVVLGRLAPGATLRSADARTEQLAIQLAAAIPVPGVNRRGDVIPLWQSPYGAQRFLLPVVTVLGVMGGLVLMIVCTNLASVVLARGLDRRGEVAVRLALGATRPRIVRLLLLESLMLAAAAAVAGLLVAALLARLNTGDTQVASMAPSELGPAPGWLVVAFAMLAAGACALLSGFLPALRTSRVPLASVMNGSGASAGRARTAWRGLLVSAQVAGSLLLLVAAGLTLRTVRAAEGADIGFDPADTVSVAIDLQLNGYDAARGSGFQEQLLERLRARPGIDSAALAAFAPLRMVEGGSRDVTADGYQPVPGEDMRLAYNVVSPQYFRTMRIALVAGREFERSDAAGGLRVAIVNETMARRFWQTPQQAVGRRVQVGRSEDDWRTVVGVARDIKYHTLTEPPAPYIYLPLAQEARPDVMIHARGSTGSDELIAQVRRDVSALDRDLPVVDAQTLSAQARMGTFLYEAVAGGLALFGLLAIGLASVGLYGLVAYAARQREHEIGIRVALGARRADLVRELLRTGVRMGAIGASAGLVLALGVSHAMTVLLYGVSPTDPVAYGAALAIVLGVTLLASFVPAWRAARTDPIRVLRRH
jgi:predicted permease